MLLRGVLLCGISTDIFLRVTALFKEENINTNLYTMTWNAFSLVSVKSHTNYPAR